MSRCPICGKEFLTEIGMHVHMTAIHGENSWSKHGYHKLTPDYDEATIAWLNQRSDENLLYMIKNHINNLTVYEAKHAKKNGLTKAVSGGHRRGLKIVLTSKGREILTRINGGEE